MGLVVVDSSAAIDLILRTERAASVAPVLLGGDHALHAPTLIDTEAVMALRRYRLRGELTERRAIDALDFYRELPIRIHPVRPLVGRAWGLKEALGVPDAFYVALAESLDAPVLTTDDRLARAIEQSDAIATRAG